MNDCKDVQMLTDQLNEREKNIIQYLNNDLRLEQLTDPQKKQINFEVSKKQTIFSQKTLDSDSEISEFNSSSTIKSTQLKMNKSPLLIRRLSTIMLEQIF
ncbi:unnamed protein product (macronuclear) [Paramecium tetraurelia]|uniref:Uncharacterized protein n=1 Tax=Paramecium tetraurelia TaxID=5888 RepID=A0E9I4_PARTE|nr:uncharacterized protein GSPATT00024682001 [Paramecium tetraurelia]CAK91951.1 unnamed protein product [Paramecium tetraurelia]|eukprot:XP_001459348.1 hypothetical protein (macronuclear) [Paramecium tetraurelia strain d4-2]